MAGRESGIAGGVLAGGAGRRMGGIRKGRIRLDGVPLLSRTVALLARLFEEVIVVGAEKELPPELRQERPPGLLLARDLLPGRGPLAGIQAGLARTSREGVFFVACDMPFLHPALIRRMSRGFLDSGCDIRLPRVGPWIEPLHALYRAGLAERMRRLLLQGTDLSIRAIFAECRTCYFQVEDTPRVRRAFFNLNTPEDLARLRAEGWSVETEAEG